MTPDGSFDIWGSARSQVRALKNREISATELLEIYRMRIEQFNPGLNAIVVKCLDRAAERAREIDALPSGDVPGPLCGLPMTLKESFEVTGLQTTGGLIDLKGRISEFDAPHVEALNAAGMVLMGKTNIPTGCADLQSDSPVYGRAVNPWNPERTPGGSSGGSAAAVASAMSPLELGTDIGGSIRVPANFCGIYGLRTSETAFPRWGDYPGSTHPNPTVVMTVAGPIARTPGDLELALDIINRPDPGENVGWSLKIPPARHQSLSGMRVGILQEMDWVQVSSEILAGKEKVRKAAEVAGSVVVDVDPEEVLDGSLRHHLDYKRLLHAIVSSDLSKEQQELMLDLTADRPEFQAALRDALKANPAAVFGWFARREQQRARYRDLFTRVDVLIAPITLRTAFPHIPEKQSVVDIYKRTVEVDAETYPYDLQVVYPGVATFAGQPSVSFPTGLAADGLPIGLQAIGPYLEDRTPIRFAELIAEEIGGFTPPLGF
ncbi:MAG: amidase [Sphaerobacteraceae bacterium]|nr:MAG: amidase [Sphaerobacteraceae bacterium]